MGFQAIRSPRGYPEVIVEDELWSSAQHALPTGIVTEFRVCTGAWSNSVNASRHAEFRVRTGAWGSADPGQNVCSACVRARGLGK